MKQLRNQAGTIVVAAVVALFVVIVMQPFAGRATQGNQALPTTGVFSGLTEQNDINAALDALLTCNSGSTAPTNAQGGVPKEGQCWLDTTSATLKIKKRYTGSGWVVEGVLDVTNGIWIPASGGGIGTVASAATTDLCVVPQGYQNVTGTTTITSFGSSCAVGTKRMLVFAGAVTLTYNVTSMILPAAVSYTTAAGDVIQTTYEGSSNWRVTAIHRASGQAVVNPAVDVGVMLMTTAAAVPSAKYVFGFGQALTRTSFPDYLAAVTRAQNGTMTSGNPTATGVSDTSGMGAGMPIEGSCYPANTTILSVTGSSITASANATTNGACSLTVFFTGYGSGGSATTIGVPDCRGRVMAGRDDLGGTAASRLTTAGTGFNAASTALNVGSGAESYTMARSDMPNVSPTFTGSTNSVIVSLNNSTVANGSSTAITPVFSGNPGTPAGTISSLNGNVTQTAQRNVQPTLIANCMVRVLVFNFPPANDNPPIAHGREPVAFDRRLA